ncbi:hypothetical protein BASA81_000407 [Batrachochytrium salamandrivorans]|nr:hypothetical protein BASA81_000407 [Batrachochytrium salamandrivorans]
MKLESLAKLVSSTPTSVRGINVPAACSFSTDGKLLVFLDTAPQGNQFLACLDLETNERRDLFRTDDAGDDESNLSPEEKMRRERMRQYATGVTSYSWNGYGRIFLPLQGGLYALDPFTKTAPELETVIPKSASGKPSKVAFQISPNCTKIGFCQGGEMYVSYLEDGGKFGEPVRQSFGAGDGVTNGLASYLAQEEMDRSEGFWFAKAAVEAGAGGVVAEITGLEDELLAYERVDERAVKQVVIAGEFYRYPFAGEANPISQLCVCSTKARKLGNNQPCHVIPLQLLSNLDREEEVYLAKVEWYSAHELVIQLLNRKQTKLELQFVDCRTNAIELFLVEENVEAWVNLHPSNCTFLPNSKDCRYLWCSERNPEVEWRSQLYLYDRAQLIRRITPSTGPPFVIDTVLSVDGEMVYFTGNLSHAMDRNVLAVNWTVDDNNNTVEMITNYGTAHNVVFSPNHDKFVLTHSSASEPVSVTLQRRPHSQIKKQRILAPKDQNGEDDEIGRLIHYEFNTNQQFEEDTLLSARFAFSELPSFATSPPSKFSCRLLDGRTVLHSQLFIPQFTGKNPGPFPTIVYIYGGPHVQRVCNNWQASVDFRCQALRKMGFLVVKCDSRGSARRGLGFESPIKHSMGTIELEDQIQVLEQLRDLGLVDWKRGVGIMGWSYGGYMSALAVAKHANVFKVAVAGAPVTFWQGYDTCYTERYMGTPQDNESGYATSSVMGHIKPHSDDDLPFGKLLLIHGMLDENVHLTHSTKLIERLTECNKPYDLVVLPQERHGPRNPANKAYIESRILAYFSAHL